MKAFETKVFLLKIKCALKAENFIFDREVRNLKTNTMKN